MQSSLQFMSKQIKECSIAAWHFLFQENKNTATALEDPKNTVPHSPLSSWYKLPMRLLVPGPSEWPAPCPFWADPQSGSLRPAVPAGISPSGLFHTYRKITGLCHSGHFIFRFIVKTFLDCFISMENHWFMSHFLRHLILRTIRFILIIHLIYEHETTLTRLTLA